MTHQAVDAGPGRTQYIFTGWAEVKPEVSRPAILVFLEQPHTCAEIARELHFAKTYVAQLLGKYRSQIESVGMRGHEKIYRSKQ